MASFGKFSIIISDTNNQSAENANCQILFSKEGDAVKGSIGLGTPGSATHDNHLQLNGITGENILFKLAGSQKGYLNSSGFQPGSDRRLKKNIEKLDSSYCLEKALKLNPVSWYWKDENPDTHQEIGFIAQDVSNVIPQVVSWDLVNKDGSIKEGARMGLSYGNLTAITTGAIQELNKKLQEQQLIIVEQKATLETQKATLETQKATLETQKTDIETQKQQHISSDNKINELNIQISEKNTMIDDLKNENIELKGVNVELKNRLNIIEEILARNNIV